MDKKNFMLVLSSPSGAGKTTLAKMLLETHDDLKISVSVTTREKRPNEADGKDYYFVSKEEFERLIENDELIEYAEVFGNYYGTLKTEIKKIFDTGNNILFDIDWQGKASLEKIDKDNLVSIFILPPSLAQLEERLRNRASDRDEIIIERMEKAKAEISHYVEYDYVIINNKLDESVILLNAIIQAEKLKITRQKSLKKFVNSLL